MPLLNVKQQGSGPCLVLLHGLFGQANNLLPIARSLAENFCVIVPDLRNHGQSFHAPSMSYQEMADDVIALLDHLGVDDFYLLGHSMGGKVAMHIAQMRSQRVAALVCADIAPVDYPFWHSEIINSLQAIDLNSVASRKQVDDTLIAAIPEIEIRQFLLSNLKRRDGSWYWQFGLQGIADAYAQIASNSLQPKPVNCPSLFIKGELSDYITEDGVEPIRYYFPTAQFKIISGAGHWLHSQKPEVFTGIVRRFFQARQAVASLG